MLSSWSTLTVTKSVAVQPHRTIGTNNSAVRYSGHVLAAVVASDNGTGRSLLDNGINWPALWAPPARAHGSIQKPWPRAMGGISLPPPACHTECSRDCSPKSQDRHHNIVRKCSPRARPTYNCPLLSVFRSVLWSYPCATPLTFAPCSLSFSAILTSLLSHRRALRKSMSSLHA